MLLLQPQNWCLADWWDRNPKSCFDLLLCCSLWSMGILRNLTCIRGNFLYTVPYHDDKWDTWHFQDENFSISILPYRSHPYTTHCYTSWHLWSWMGHCHLNLWRGSRKSRRTGRWIYKLGRLWKSSSCFYGWFYHDRTAYTTVLCIQLEVVGWREAQPTVCTSRMI